MRSALTSMLRGLNSSEISGEWWNIFKQGITQYNICCRKLTLSACDGLTRKGKLEAEENHM